MTGFDGPNTCTCHPSERIDPCARRYAAGECQQQAFHRRIVDIAWNEATESKAVQSTDWADRMIERARKEKP
jgi:hypothetical protein